MSAIAGFEDVLANMTQQHNAVLAQLAQQHTAALAQQAEQHAAALAQQAEQHAAALAQQAEQHAAVLAQQAQQHVAAQAQRAQQAQQHAGQHQQIVDLLNALQASVQQGYVSYLSLLLTELTDVILQPTAAVIAAVIGGVSVHTPFLISAAISSVMLRPGTWAHILERPPMDPNVTVAQRQHILSIFLYVQISG